MIVHHDVNSPLGAHLHVAADVAAVAGHHIQEAIERSVQRSGRCRIGLAGGSTPAPAFAWLRAHLPAAVYGQLWITWVDERHLPLAEGRDGDWQRFGADSNLRLAYEHWLAHVPVVPQQVLPMTFGGELKADVVRFGRAFVTAFDGGLDVSVLGVGPDGHIASIFPDHPGLDVDDVCFAVHDSPKPPPQRISLGLPVLRRAGATFVLATGAGKAAVLARAWQGDAALPLGRLHTNTPAHWIVDPAAAAGILTGNPST